MRTSRFMSRRGMLLAGLGILAGLPVLRYVQLRLISKPFEQYAEPQVTVVDGWVLDTRDLDRNRPA